MKILESYLGIAKSLFMEAEIDDEEMIKYKDKDGESKEMKAGSAKTMDKEHPAKIEYDKMADKGGEEEPKGKGLGKGDFERDFDDGEPEDKPHGGDTGKDADFQGEPPEGAREPDDVDDEEPKDEPADEPKEKQPYTNADGKFDKDAANNEIGPASQWGANYNPFTKSLNDKEFDRYTKSREDGMSHTDAFRVAEHPSPEEQKKQLDKEISALQAQAREANSANDPLTAKELLKTAKDLAKKKSEISSKDKSGEIDPELDLYKKAAAQGMTPDQYKSMHGESGNESITIDGKKYRPIKESKQHIFKEIYDRTFRSLK